MPSMTYYKLNMANASKIGSNQNKHKNSIEKHTFSLQKANHDKNNNNKPWTYNIEKCFH